MDQTCKIDPSSYHHSLYQLYQLHKATWYSHSIWTIASLQESYGPMVSHTTLVLVFDQASNLLWEIPFSSCEHDKEIIHKSRIFHCHTSDYQRVPNLNGNSQIQPIILGAQTRYWADYVPLCHLIVMFKAGSLRYIRVRPKCLFTKPLSEQKGHNPNVTLWQSNLAVERRMLYTYIYIYIYVYTHEHI